MRAFALTRWVCAALVCGLSVTGTQAGLFDDDEARKAILELRTKVDALNAERQKEILALGEELTLTRRALLDLNNSIESLRAEIARSRGASEQQLGVLSTQVAALQSKQKELLVQTEERLKQLEPVSVEIDGQRVSLDPAEKRAFDEALALFKSSEFVRANQAFVEFQSRYARSAYAAQALYYGANAQYALKDCKTAVETFGALVSRFPADRRSPEALLSVGNCQLELGSRPNARRAYEALAKQYPLSEEAATAKDRLARIK